MFEDKYEVEFPMYRDFLRSLKQGCFIQEKKNEEEREILTISSKSSGNLICGWTREGNNYRYYIVSLPRAFESVEVKPVNRVVLTTPQQVQAVLKGLKELKEKNKNG